MENLIIIPTYNERENVKTLIPKIFQLLHDVHVLVVDDNSPDGTAEEVKTLQASYPNLDLFSRAKKEGLGRAYIDAFRQILPKHAAKKIITMDADLSHDPANLTAMLALAADHELVIGSRYARGGRTVGWELWRRVLSRGGNFYCRAVTGMPVQDCTSGFMVIAADALRRLDFAEFDLSGYAFLIELKHALWKNGARTLEQPIVFHNRSGGESKISNHIIREGVIAPWKLRFKKSKKTAGRLFARKNGFDIYRCSACGLLFVAPMPADAGKIYEADYFCGARCGHGYVDYDTDKLAMSGAFARYLVLLEKLLGRSGSLLDIGAATGFFISLAKNRGWQVAGLEISQYAAARGREKGLDLRTGTLSTAGFGHDSFDAVTMLDVIEHLPDPRAELKLIHKVLKTDGLLLVNTPDAGSLYAKIMGTRWHSLVPPEHLILFNFYNLTRLLRASGFAVVHRGKIAKKFSLRYTAQIAANWLKIAPLRALAERLNRSRIGSLAVPIPLRDNLLVIARKI